METEPARMPIEDGQGTVALVVSEDKQKLGIEIQDHLRDLTGLWLTPNEARQLAALIRVYADGLDPAGT